MDSEYNYENHDEPLQSNELQDRFVDDEGSSFFLGPAYSLAEEKAMDREALNEMGDVELPNENDEILDEIGIVPIESADPILQPTVANRFDSDSDANSQDIQVVIPLDNLSQPQRPSRAVNEDLNEDERLVKFYLHFNWEIWVTCIN